MKSAYRSVMFYLGQKELEMQYKMNRIVSQCRQKCESMQEKFTEKLEQVHTAYQKMAKRCQMMEQEMESLSKDKQELQEKFSEKSRSIYCLYHCVLTKLISFIMLRCDSWIPKNVKTFPGRQKRKLDEMYDQLRSEYESMKRAAIQPANSFYPRNEADLFSNPAVNMMDDRDPIRKGNLTSFYLCEWMVYVPTYHHLKKKYHCTYSKFFWCPKALLFAFWCFHDIWV